MPTTTELAVATGVFRLLADGTRVQLILLLRDGEQTVGDLAEAIGAAPAAISQHLAKLRLAGLVTTRRDGAFVHYALADGHLVGLVDEAISHAVHATR